MKHALNILLLILTLVSCKNQSNSELNKATPEKSTEVETLKFRQIIFGMYCGECDENCAPIFRLIMDKNAPTLSADFEDSYFNLESKLEFKTDLNQEKELKIANEIAENIPETLYNWKSEKESKSDKKWNEINSTITYLIKKRKIKPINGIEFYAIRNLKLVKK